MSLAPRYAWLPAALEGDAVVLCGSRRLARELVRFVDAQMLAQGRRAWTTPPVRYWQDWLAERLADSEQASLPQLLDSASTGLLWEQALERTRRESVIGLAGVVRHAQAAWTRIADWQIVHEDVAAAARSRDEHWFARAAAYYAERLAEGGWIDAAGLAATCTAFAGRGGIDWPRRIVLAGFDRLTPAQASLFAALAEAGVGVEQAPRATRAGSATVTRHRDAESLWRSAGRWAREALERDPNARIAIVVPDLERDAATVGRLVREGFAPGWQARGAAWRDTVNLSYGERLAAYPAIAVALLWLEFAANGVRGPAVSILLRSPFGSADDPGGRARLELALRRLPDRDWTPPALLAALEDRRHPERAEDWRARVAAVAALHDAGERSASPASWAERIDACLAGLGWHGTAPLDSEAFQLLNRWRALLNQLARLDRVRPAMTLREAVRRLAQLAADTVFQPESDDALLDVLGLLETAGLEFDALWLGGLDASRWPPPGNPLALVNRRLQREHAMPDATPADTLAFARRTLERLHAAAPERHVAWARSEDDAELLPSPLLAGADAATSGDDDDPGWHAATRLGCGRLRPIDGDAAPPVRRGESIRGGAYTVQRMQEEAFSAFAAGRLAADVLDPFATGLTPRQRGTLVHAALHELLEGCPGQDELRRWDDLPARAERAAFAAQRRLAAHADPVLLRVLRLERQRLERLLQAFVARELEREPFRIVSLEADARLVRGAVELSLRIDRIDRLADGRLLLLDYKAGAPKSFLGREREPKSVQLSVYAAAVDGPVGALAYCNVNSRSISWDGAGGEFSSGRTRIAADDWPAALARWCGEVDTLLRRFADGDIGVNVLQAASKARPLALLSRVAELRHDD